MPRNDTRVGECAATSEIVLPVLTSTESTNCTASFQHRLLSFAPHRCAIAGYVHMSATESSPPRFSVNVNQNTTAFATARATP